MNEPGNQPENQAPDYSQLQRHLRETRYRRSRASIRESIDTAPSTLLINLIIEVLAALVLLVGILYTVKFLFARRELLEPGRFKLYIEVLIFFSLAWFTYVGFKVRAKFTAFRNRYRKQPPDIPAKP